jgi:protein O-mannosyl-transferase
MAKRKQKQAILQVKNTITTPQQVGSQAFEPFDSKWVPLVLSVLVFIFYAKVWNNGLVWDDDPYITLNDAVINFDLKELLSGFHVGNYHPLTMLSLAIEYALVGESPWLYHLTNLLFHVANSWLVFKLFSKLKVSFWISFITSVFFAIHPLHVESVAWAAERKDVLYTFFLMLSFIMYLSYAATKNKIVYTVSVLLFLTSCLSKGMAVVMPALLIITDWWFLDKKFNFKNLLDKIPYFAITLFFAWLATTAQKDAGADATSVISAAYTVSERIRIVSFSFLFYWFKTILPFDLLPFYPYPPKINGSIPGIFSAALLGVVLFAGATLWLGRKDKKLWWSVAFFIIAISTVLQILPVGSAIVADRYYYLSSIGPLFLIGFLIFRFIKNQKSAIFISSLIALYFAVLTFFRLDIGRV